MDCCGRRGRRGRNRCHQQPCIPYGAHNINPGHSKPWSFLSGLYSFFIMSTLMAIIYLMLEYHCSTCSAKCNLNGITRNIDDITKNLMHIKQGYRDLEIQISRFSHELPKLEGQIEILETLTKAMESKDFQWNPKTHLTLPGVDVYLRKTENGKNVSHLSSKHYEDLLKVGLTKLDKRNTVDNTSTI